MYLNVIAFKNSSTSYSIRTNKKIELDLARTDTVEIVDDSTTAALLVIPSNIQYISSGDETELGKRGEEIKRKAKLQELKNERKPKPKGMKIT